jgi:hypothetical protein
MKSKTIIIVEDHLDKKLKESFENMEIECDEINTVHKVILKDEAHLHWILCLIIHSELGGFI